MTTRSKIFRAFLGLEYLGFFGLILLGVSEADTFNTRLLVPITVLGISCCIGSLALLNPTRRTNPATEAKGRRRSMG
jgi:hypothetical protein